MTRRITLQDGGRDLVFEIRKLPATQAEDFIYRVASLAGRNLNFGGDLSGVDLLRALFASKHEDAKELLDVLLGCCSYVKDKALIAVSYENADGFITSPLTLMRLRAEAVKENFDFLSGVLGSIIPAGPSTSGTVERSEARPGR